MISSFLHPLTLGISLNFSLEPLWHDTGIPLALMGMFIVFFALIFISMFISRLPHIMAVLDKYLPQAEQLLNPPKPREGEISDEVIAVIAAAVSEALGKPHRIIHTRELTSRDMAWPQQGRWQIQTSHIPQK
ncbi:OadG family protein [Bythopirellula polymerisocia]|uniref:Oxaloacetate decarboxylase, gamma chain n=1 Tax=Bythopirellula polymerisocia TaxID=2528003 RepID=A0A5C6D4J1_9BACT|nr:OadG family protein [Bythopirellula polymerisocia]TWU29769.1 Oxaloacetate decarboxylase, gamma chain [Bythopirellula polymerisocia]